MTDRPDWRRRFAAWWNGEDLDAAPSESAPKPRAGRKASARKPVKYKPKLPALSAHLQIAAELWGEGYIGPGGPEFIHDLTGPLSIRKEQSIAFVGAGLGGPAREMSRETGAWITGYETRPDLIELGTEQSVMSGMAKKVELLPFRPEDTKLQDMKYHVIISRDELCLMPGKAALIDMFYQSLKHSGVFFFTDYVVTPDGEQCIDRLSKKAFNITWGQPDLWSVQTYRECLAKAGFDIRVQKNMSDIYVDLISKSSGGWGRIMGLLEGSNSLVTDKSEFIDAVALEAALWAERLEALKSEKLAVYRFLAMKPDKPLR